MISLPMTPRRAEISDVYERLDTEPQYVIDAALVSGLGKLGLRVITPGRIGLDNYYRCGHYVFGDHLNEPWAQRGMRLPGGLFTRTTDFLQARGYDEIVRPVVAAGDVVAYFGQSELRHVGLVTAVESVGDLDVRVLSKLGAGPVAETLVDEVPEWYGTEITFYRKQTS